MMLGAARLELGNSPSIELVEMTDPLPPAPDP